MSLETLSTFIAIATSLIALGTTLASVVWKLSRLELSIQQKLNDLRDKLGTQIGRIERDIQLNKQQDISDLEMFNFKIETLSHSCKGKIADCKSEIADMRDRIQQVEGCIAKHHMNFKPRPYDAPTKPNPNES